MPRAKVQALAGTRHQSIFLMSLNLRDDGESTQMILSRFRDDNPADVPYPMMACVWNVDLAVREQGGYIIGHSVDTRVFK